MFHECDWERHELYGQWTTSSQVGSGWTQNALYGMSVSPFLWESPFHVWTSVWQRFEEDRHCFDKDIFICNEDRGLSRTISFFTSYPRRMSCCDTRLLWMVCMFGFPAMTGQALRRPPVRFVRRGSLQPHLWHALDFIIVTETYLNDLQCNTAQHHKTSMRLPLLSTCSYHWQLTNACGLQTNLTVGEK